jgi:Na+/proline symporter
MLFGFLFFLLGLTCLVGFFAVRESRKSEEDYFLASQTIAVGP